MTSLKPIRSLTISMTVITSCGMQAGQNTSWIERTKKGSDIHICAIFVKNLANLWQILCRYQAFRSMKSIR